jgi:hypothetical protein
MLKTLTSFNHWISIPLKSGLFFWFAGLLVFCYQYIDWIVVHHLLNGISNASPSLIIPQWQSLWLWLHQQAKPEHLGFLLFCILFIFMLSQAIISRLTFSTLRLLEGYGWLWLPLGRLIIFLSDRLYYAPRSQRFHQMGNPVHLSRQQQAEYIRLEDEQLYLLDKTDRLPTRLGNILRSHERRPAQKYGLDAIVCWSHLWLLLPENAQKDIHAARQTLDDGIQIWLWSALMLIWGFWAWWMPLIALLFMLMSYHWILQAAHNYGRLIETAFDLYRPLLYQALRFPLPDNPATEICQGQQLTAYLLRGTTQDMSFVAKTEQAE